MSIVRDTTRAIRMTLVLWLLTAIISSDNDCSGSSFLPKQANGSLVQNQGKW